MSTQDDIANQLADTLNARIVIALDALGWLDLAAVAGERLNSATTRLAEQLLSEDDSVAAQAVLNLTGIAWDAEPPADWWRTPLGRIVARNVRAEESAPVTHQGAALMLGISRGTVGTLVSRGKLERHPDGGVTKASVLARLARNHTPGMSQRWAPEALADNFDTDTAIESGPDQAADTATRGDTP